MTNWKTAQPFRHRVRRMGRREFMFLLAGATTAPRAVRAQQTGMSVIGVLGNTSPASAAPAVGGFLRGLSEVGYVDGQNLAIEYRLAEGHYDRLPAFATDLVSHKVDLILAGGDGPALAAKNATSTIPIIFSIGSDPVELGLVASFPRPGGNLTGVSIMNTELVPKRLDLLSELLPHGRVIVLLVNPKNPGTEAIILAVREAARAKGVQLEILPAGSESEINAAFATLVQLRADGLLVSTDTFFYSAQDQLVGLAGSHPIPAIYFSREFSAAGGLISYGPNITAMYRQCGIYAGKVLNGAKPADLPVVQSATFELVVNLKTAKALGLTIPPTILARADEVIE